MPTSNNPILVRKKVYDSTGVFYYLEEEKVGVKARQVDQKRNGLFGLFYKSDANFYEINTENFSLRANPILNFKYGDGADDSSIIFQNTRGAEIRGMGKM